MITLSSNMRTLKSFTPSPKAIVIDDDDSWLETLSRRIQRAGFVVSGVQSLSAAKERLRREFFHVAAIDLSLIPSDPNNRDGFHVLDIIRNEMREGCQGIVLTAYGGLEDGSLATRKGAFTVLEKPKVLDRPQAELKADLLGALCQARAALSKYHPGLNFLTGPGVQEDRLARQSTLLSALGVPFDRLDKLTSTLLSPFNPLLTHQPPVVRLEGATKLVSARFWSKAVGSPVLILLGARDAIAQVVTRFQTSPQSVDTLPPKELLAHHEHKDLGAVLFATAEPSLGAFASALDPYLRQV